MLPYGSKRILAKCETSRPRKGGKIHVKQYIKSKKFGRKVNYTQEDIKGF